MISEKTELLLILSSYIKIINLITSFPCAQVEKKSHKWDFENIFTEAKPGSIFTNIGFCCEGSKWVGVTLGTGKTLTAKTKRKKNIK